MEQLHERRKQVVRLHKKGIKVMQIVAMTGLSYPKVRGVIDQLGWGATRPALCGRNRGDGRVLSAAQEQAIQRQIIDQRPEPLKMDFSLWSRAVVGQLIEQEFGIRLQVRIIGKYLARWGFTPQKPIKKVYEQRPEAVQQWLQQEYPAIERRARAEGAQIHWEDETALVNTDVRRQGTAGTLDATGLISKVGLRLESAELAFDAPALAPLFATDVQPFLIGTPLDGLLAQGAARGSVSLRGGSPTALAAEFSGVALSAGRLGLSVDDLSGQVHWAGAGAKPSSLQWSAGSIGRIPLGPSEVSFRAQGRDLELLAPWRQPLLEGAVHVQRLALSKVGLPQLDADFRAVLEPIDLAALCRALDWPVFGGTLAGQLPGLRVQNEVWSIDGALEAQVFDGTLRLENLQAIEPFGVLPRVTADIHLRRLDLEAITGTFRFGRITGRLDGDVEGLRLLDWKPVAFDARFHSTPGDDSTRRISQRAIDNISAIGGGPTGLLSRGFMSIFKDFSYDRMGVGCVLRDGRCRMDGIEPAPPHDGQTGYYLVKGRLLPRIDVIGYTREVSWDTLVQQVEAALASGGPQTQ